MTDRNELVARLRMVTEDDAYAHPFTFTETCREAAARIESDAATIARLEGERDGYRRMMRLERVIADKNADKATTAEAKVAALVEALTLYASESLYDHDGNPDGMKPIERDGGQTARAILWPERFAAKGAK